MELCFDTGKTYAVALEGGGVVARTIRAALP